MYVWKDLIIQETTHLQQSRVIYELPYACFSLCLLTLKCNLWLRRKRCLQIHMYHKQMYSFVLLDLKSSFGTGKQRSESLLPSFPLLDMGCLSAELFSRSHLFARVVFQPWHNLCGCYTVCTQPGWFSQEGTMQYATNGV